MNCFVLFIFFLLLIVSSVLLEILSKLVKGRKDEQEDNAYFVFNHKFGFIDSMASLASYLTRVSKPLGVFLHLIP
jgi:hypothetical protein